MRNEKIEAIKNDINRFNEKINEFTELDEFVSEYNNRLAKILDKHAPEKSVKITMRGNKPWSSNDICPDKTLKRILENKMKKTNLNIDKLNYKHQRNKYNTLLNDLCGKDIMKTVTENKDDPRGLFKVLNKAQYQKKQ